MSIEPAVPPDRAALEKSSTAERGTRRCHVVRPFRQRDVDCEPRVVAERGYLPQHVIKFRTGLANFQVCRANFVGDCVLPERDEPHENQKLYPHFITDFFASLVIVGADSISTVYRLRKPS